MIDILPERTRRKVDKILRCPICKELVSSVTRHQNESLLLFVELNSGYTVKHHSSFILILNDLSNVLGVALLVTIVVVTTPVLPAVPPETNRVTLLPDTLLESIVRFLPVTVAVLMVSDCNSCLKSISKSNTSSGSFSVLNFNSTPAGGILILNVAIVLSLITDQ